MYVRMSLCGRAREETYIDRASSCVNTTHTHANSHMHYVLGRNLLSVAQISVSSITSVP